MRRVVFSVKSEWRRPFALTVASKAISTTAGMTSWEHRGHPSATSPFPYDRPQFRKTHIEWMLHHGHGNRYNRYGPTRETADVEYADGTPTPVSPRRFAFKHHQDHLLVQLIRAGAAVERYESLGLLPRVPGTAEQRDWDPEIPLFLDDVDEHGAPRVARPPVHGGGSAAVGSTDGMTARVIDERFTASRTSGSLENTHAGESLEENTLFATYDPAAFVSDAPVAKKERPFWSRRRWALTDDFLLPVSPKPKNTIKDE